MPLICESLLHFLKQRYRFISIHHSRHLGNRLRVLQSEQGRTDECKLRDSVLLSRRGETTSGEDTRGSPSLVSRLVKQRAGVNPLCLSSIPPPSTLHPLTRARPPPPPLPYPNISLPVSLSKLSKPERRVGVGGELGPDFSAAEEPEGPMGYSGYQPPILQY